MHPRGKGNTEARSRVFLVYSFGISPARRFCRPSAWTERSPWRRRSLPPRTERAVWSPSQEAQSHGGWPIRSSRRTRPPDWSGCPAAQWPGVLVGHHRPGLRLRIHSLNCMPESVSSVYPAAKSLGALPEAASFPTLRARDSLLFAHHDPRVPRRSLRHQRRERVAHHGRVHATERGMRMNSTTEERATVSITLHFRHDPRCAESPCCCSQTIDDVLACVGYFVTPL